MYLYIFASSLSLFSLARAGQNPLSVEIHADSCRISENKPLLALSQELTGGNYNQERCGLEQVAHASASSPWTKSPTCMPKENSTSTYCVYTNDQFASGRGISFFTSPSIAERITALPAFAGEDIYSNVNMFDDPSWEVKVIPGRGKGLFATRTLYRGDRILASTPLGVYQSDALVRDSAMDYIYLHTAFIHLPKSSQEQFLSAMAGSKGDPIMERVNTNAFSGEFEGAPHFLMYPETAVSCVTLT
jgi:hypothetical protein